MSDFTALTTYLKPLQEILDSDGVNEISINKPNELWIEKQGDLIYHRIEGLDFIHLRSLADLIAQSTDQMISEEKPLLSATLPSGQRIQVVIPPACESNTIAMSIRKPNDTVFSLADYEKMGAFDALLEPEDKSKLHELKALFDEHKIRELLEKAVLYKQNIIISGGTSTGKTTFTNAMLSVIPTTERIITCEDTREIVLKHHPNRLHLIASKGGQGQANVTIQNLIEACLRLRPDRIVVGEVRGAEAFSFLRAINTGHPGSICTLHADSPEMAVEQLKLMVLQAGLGIPTEEIKNYILHVVDIIIQLKRASGGRRYVSNIFFCKSNHEGENDK